ncbi:MAG: gamma-glutamyl-gamma-aminobutyrate hydrolase family protein [Actinomycetota bacterium]
MKPLIGIVGRRKKGHDIAAMPESLHHLDLELYFSDYSRGVLAAGGLPVHIPIEADPAAIAARIDGVLLSGGADVAPALYGQDAETDLYPPEADRDRMEMALMDAAVDTGMPVLGICRGLQIANVHGGGSLHQHVPEQARYDIAPTAVVDAVRFESDSVLGRLYGEHRDVNTLHHQTVDRVAADYRVTAWGADGGVEGLEHAELPIVSVQWHPEMMTERDTDPVFGWLVEAAKLYAAAR